MSSSIRKNQPRSSTGHVLLPATNATSHPVMIPMVPTKTLLSWTFGRGTVIWRIWPAVLLHTVFAAAVISVSLTTRFKLGIPNVMLTLLGVVIGFVISYRAMSGYDRYWQGRSYWSDVMRTSRTFARLIWFHVPMKTGTVHDDPATTNDDHKAKKDKKREVRRMMAEKRMALDLVEAFSVALKHHLRGEIGLYYEDLYHLVRPLHEHDHQQHKRSNQDSAENAQQDPFSTETPFMDIYTSPTAGPSTQTQSIPTATEPTPKISLSENPVIPPINAYGTFSSTSNANHPSNSHHLVAHRSLSTSSTDSSISTDNESRLLLPSHVPRKEGVMSKVSGDLIPFANVFGSFVKGITKTKKKVFGSDLENGPDTPDEGNTFVDANDVIAQRRWAESGRISTVGFTHAKHRPRIAGGGDNTPLLITRALTQWLSVMEARGTVPGNTLGGMFGCLGNFEDSLSGLERILTTPLPFVFSNHIRTVWIYLFFLPFQLVDLFEWYAIPGVAIAAFIYLGFVASGEEIEQPFGYDENDLDLDMFCREVIHADFEHLKRTPCMNVFIGSHHDIDETLVEPPEAVAKGRVEEVFGHD